MTDLVITVESALEKAVGHAMVSGSADRWALIAIALHLTGTAAMFDRGEYRIVPQTQVARDG